MSSKKSCPHCNSSDLDQDPARGEIHCTSCGHVLESNLIVSEVQFEEGSRGGSHVIGQHVGEHGTCRPHIGSIFGSSRESRHVTLDNAKKKIGAVAAQLRLNKNCQDVAFTFYKRALQKRLTHGRKNTHVIAACIYITCRTETTSHMLLDLSDVMQVNVYELGRTYLKLSSALHINIPAIDPCIYIVRFASKLDLSGKHHEIEMTAMRIAQRMKRDWMHFGRRPSGLCGSALLVAARLHDVHCSIKEIIRVVKVCEATIRKRLSEFGDTPTSKLTLDEFMSVDLEGEEDPPCFKAARKKKTQELNTKISSEEVTKQVSSLERQIEEELEKTRKTRRSPFASFSRSFGVGLDVEDETGIVEEVVRTGMAQAVSDIIQGDEDQILPSASVLRLTETFGLCEPAVSSYTSIQLSNKENTASDSSEKGADQNEVSGELFTDDLDDNEIDSYILDDNEAKIKRSVWERVNADWIKESAEKAKRKAEEEAEQRLKEEKGELPVKKKRKVKKKNPIQANSAGEAIEKMLQEKRISNKINYDVLKQLSGHSIVTAAAASDDARERPVCLAEGQETTPVASTAATSANTGAPVRRLPSIRNFVASHIRLPQRRGLSSISSAGSSRVSEAVDQVADATRSGVGTAAGQEEEGMPSSGNEELTTVSRDELPVASAPAATAAGTAADEFQTKEQFQGRGEQEEDEDEEEDDEEDDQNQQMSIAQLMSQRTGVAVDDDDDHLADMTDHEEYD